MEKDRIKSQINSIVEDLNTINNMYSRPTYYRNMYMPYESLTRGDQIDKNVDYAEYGKYLEYYSRRLLDVIDEIDSENDCAKG